MFLFSLTSPSFIQEIFMGCLICAQHRARCWGHSSEQKGKGFPLLKPTEERDPWNESTQSCETCQEEREACKYFWLHQGQSVWVWFSWSDIFEPQLGLSVHLVHRSATAAPQLLVNREYKRTSVPWQWPQRLVRLSWCTGTAAEWVLDASFTHPCSHIHWGPSMGRALI